MASPKAPVLGKATKADLPELFSEAFHESLVHEAARAEQNARRRGTSSTLGRGEVSMTTAKAWKQKGTGRARIGAYSAPQRRGGGVAFGPKPRGYTAKVNRKAARRALRSALAVHAARGTIAILDEKLIDAPSTKTAAGALAKWDVKRPTLVLVDPEQTDVLRSFRNIARVSVLPAAAAGVVDVIGAASLVVSQEAIATLEARTSAVSRGSGEGGDEG